MAVVALRRDGDLQEALQRRSGSLGSAATQDRRGERAARASCGFVTVFPWDRERGRVSAPAEGARELPQVPCRAVDLGVQLLIGLAPWFEVNLLQRVPDCPSQSSLRSGVPKNILARICALSAVAAVIKSPRLGLVREWHRESCETDLGHAQI